MKKEADKIRKHGKKNKRIGNCRKDYSRSKTGRLEWEDKRSKMWKDNSKKDETYTLKSMRRLLETRFEPKRASLEVKKRLKIKIEELELQTIVKKDWNRRIKAAKCGKGQTEKRKIY